MRDVQLSARLIAKPDVNYVELFEWVNSMGGFAWVERMLDAPDEHSAAQVVSEAAGRRCYQSWSPGLNANVTKVREDSDTYLANILKVRHGSVLEHGMFTFALEGISRVVTHELVRHRVGTAMCVSGDTLVTFSREDGTGSGKMRIDELYAWWSTRRGRRYLEKRWVRSAKEDGSFTGEKLLDIVSSGTKRVFVLMSESGYAIKATADHAFLTPTGWRKLGELNVGDTVATNGDRYVPNTAVILKNGIPAYRDFQWMKLQMDQGFPQHQIALHAGVSASAVAAWTARLGLNHYADSLRLTSKDLPNSPKPNKHKAGRKTKHWTPAQREAAAERQRGSNNPQWIDGRSALKMSRLTREKIFARDGFVCKRCGSDHRLSVHHIDPFDITDPSTNDDDNLISLCASCHGKVTGYEPEYAEELFSLISVSHRKTVIRRSYERIGRQLQVRYDRIVAITESTDEPTYDLCLTGPLHNFIGNGFVVHNSQESLRYVRLTDIPFRIPEWIEADEVLSKEAHSLLSQMENFQVLMAERAGLDDPGKDFHFKKTMTSDMRRFAPLGLLTGMVWSANIRTLRFLLETRTAEGAEREIRELFDKVGRLMLEECPALFSDFKLVPVEGSSVPAWVPESSKV